MLSHDDIPKECRKYRKNIDNYKIKSHLKTGGFGNIYLIIDKSTNEELVAKTIQSNKSTKEQILRELQIMTHFHGPTFIKFFGYSLQDFNDQNNTTFFMEYAKNGSLHDILEKERISLAPLDFNNTIKQKLLIGISFCMMILNKNSIIHRDLTPSNILLDEKFNPILIDFGLSKQFMEGFEFDQSISCGNPIYMAPENNEYKRYGKKSDVYSFGLIMYEIVTGKPIFKKKDNKYILLNEIRNHAFIPEFDDLVSEHLKNLILKCISKDPDERPTFEELYNILSYDKNYYLDGINDDIEIIKDYIEKINEETLPLTNNETIKSNKNDSKRQKNTSNVIKELNEEHSNELIREKVSINNKCDQSLTKKIDISQKPRIKNENYKKDKKLDDKSQSKNKIKDTNQENQNEKIQNAQPQSKNKIKDTNQENQNEKIQNAQPQSNKIVNDLKPEIKSDNYPINKNINEKSQSKQIAKHQKPEIKSKNHRIDKNIKSHLQSKQIFKDQMPDIKNNQNNNNKLNVQLKPKKVVVNSNPEINNGNNLNDKITNAQSKSKKINNDLNPESKNEIIQSQSKQIIKDTNPDINNKNNQNGQNITDQSQAKLVAQNQKSEIKYLNNHNNKNMNPKIRNSQSKTNINSHFQTKQNQNPAIDKNNKQLNAHSQFNNMNNNRKQKINNEKNTNDQKTNSQSQSKKIAKNINPEINNDCNQSKTIKKSQYQSKPIFKNLNTETKYETNQNYKTTSFKYSNSFTHNRAPGLEYSNNLNKTDYINNSKYKKYLNIYDIRSQNHNEEKKNEIVQKDKYTSFKFSNNLNRQDASFDHYQIRLNKQYTNYIHTETPEFKYPRHLNDASNKNQNCDNTFIYNMSAQNHESYRTYNKNFSDMLQFNMQNEYFTDTCNNYSCSKNENNECILI